MSLPFQCLSPLGRGTLFCAAKGCTIQTFDLAAGSQPLFSWTHPSCKQSQSADQANDAPEGPRGQEQPGQQPPSKRRKLGAADDTESPAGIDEGRDTPDVPASGEKDRKKAKAKSTRPRLEIPFVVLLAATEDGSHVVAVTGQDKTLWVFKHDGKGSLEEVSQRPMPKRPCSLAFAADGQTILSADKFGDVYALPLLPQAERGSVSATPASASSTPAPAPSQAVGANVFTVHSQRNRRALEDQQRQRESNAQRNLPKEGPKFEHEVLLGHVSLLTCVLAANDSRNRPYIITADRDEHIRVSRGMPQSHVIETYCLGHSSFVNALCIPHPRPAVLVSGGGDNELFAWDWLAGKRLGTVDLLTHVRGVLPDATKVAVAKLIAYEAGAECYVVATCERVPALFIFQLQTDDVLSHRATLGLRGNALDITILGVAGEALLVSVDAVGNAGDISVFERDGVLWAPRASIQGIADRDEQCLISREELDKALYTVETLRKTDNDEREDGDGDGDVPETSEKR